MKFTVKIFFILTSIMVLYLLFSFSQNDTKSFDKDSQFFMSDTSQTLSILVCGDINLGRKIGKKLLRGDSIYPFYYVRDEFLKNDIVFGNLESQLSDQNGETQHRRYNLIFTGPPEGAKTLRINGITIVSTANNHAFDYGKKAFDETIANLKSEKIFFSGTSTAKDSCYLPTIIQKKGFNIAFFAITDFVNIWKKEYEGFIAFPDTSKLFPEIRKIRHFVDLIIISYHGGNEYVEKPSKKTIDFAHQVIDCGADFFIGHHPHVIQGIEVYNKKLIFFSLGNFAFYQPQKFWTRKTFVVKLEIRKENEFAKLVNYSIKPASAGLQPYFYNKGKEYDTVVSRIKKLSPTIKKYL